MILARTVAEARAWAMAARRTGARLGLVPTMGALHDAHLALVGHCRPGVDAVAMSVFVNPTQFGPGEDYPRYPRDLARDVRLAEGAGVDLLFAPTAEEMYPGGGGTAVDVGPLGTVLEGAVRPGHFRGVAGVVLNLLHVLAPDVAVFGQKDAQQVVVVRRLVRDMLLPVEIRCMPTVRQGDGLALSSRNAFLSAQERTAALALHRALLRARRSLDAGDRSASRLEAVVHATLREEPLARPDYCAVVAAEDLAPLERVDGRMLLLVAARFGSTRLLDNLSLRVGEGGVYPDVP